MAGTLPEGSPERQLLQGFASQLGGALEMIQVRQKLVAAEGVRRFNEAIWRDMGAPPLVISRMASKSLSLGVRLSR